MSGEVYAAPRSFMTGRSVQLSGRPRTSSKARLFMTEARPQVVGRPSTSTTAVLFMTSRRPQLIGRGTTSTKARLFMTSPRPQLIGHASTSTKARLVMTSPLVQLTCPDLFMTKTGLRMGKKHGFKMDARPSIAYTRLLTNTVTPSMNCSFHMPKNERTDDRSRPHPPECHTATHGSHVPTPE